MGNVRPIIFFLPMFTFVVGCATINHDRAETRPSNISSHTPARAPATNVKNATPSNLPLNPVSPINNNDVAENNFTEADIKPQNAPFSTIVSTPPENPARAPGTFRVFKIIPKKIDVYEKPNRYSRHVGWLKRNSFVQAKVDGKWAELRGSGYVEVKNFFPPKARQTKRKSQSLHPVASRRIRTRRIARNSHK